MRVKQVLLGVLSIIGLLFASATPAAAAADDRDTSEPTGALTVILRGAGATTDHDKDGDSDTATKSDKTGVLFQVLKNFRGEDDRQLVRITVSVDGPGTAYDSTSTREVSFTDGDGISNLKSLFQVKNGTPLGEYDVTVSAAATETATATGSFVVQPSK